MENIPTKTKFNIRNKKGEFPYQCSTNSAIRDLFYRTYVANIFSDEQADIGIAKLSQKLKFSCDQYRKEMVDKYKEAQQRAEKDKKQIIASFQYKLCECKGCQGCQYNDCNEIAKYFCKNCKEFRYCDNCVRFHNCKQCICKDKSFIKIEYIPFDYKYQNFENFILNSEEKQNKEVQEPK